MPYTAERFEQASEIIRAAHRAVLEGDDLSLVAAALRIAANAVRPGALDAAYNEASGCISEDCSYCRSIVDRIRSALTKDRTDGQG